MLCLGLAVAYRVVGVRGPVGVLSAHHRIRRRCGTCLNDPNHQAYKVDVRGSKPSTPTSGKTPSRSWLGVFDIRIRHQRPRSLAAGTPSQQPVHVADGLTLGVPHDVRVDVHG